MKHIKTYKIFENYSKSPEEICEEIKEILIPLSWNNGNKLEVKVDIDNDRDTGTLIYLRITDDWSDKTGFNLVDYENEFKQLFSTLDEEGWHVDYENRPYHETGDFIRFPYFELTEPDQESEYPNVLRIEEESMFFELIDREIDKLFLKFIKNKI